MKTPRVFMVRPIRFGYNPETAVNNAFQINPKTSAEQDTKQEQIALQAFGSLTLQQKEKLQSFNEIIIL